MSNDTIKPFDAGGYFPIHNYVFDVCMKELSNAGWRILCVAIRQTWGWIGKEEMTAMGRKKWDQISYSQFQEMSGLASRSSVSAGLQECMAANYLLRRAIGTHPGTGKTIYAYSLNVNYAVPVSSTEDVPEKDKTGTASTVSVPDNDISGTEGVLAASTVSVHTKVKEIQAKDEKKVFDLWDSVLKDLALQMQQNTFSEWFQGSTVIAADNGTWTVQLKHQRAVEWVDKRLRPMVERTVERHAPGTELRFVS